MKQFLKKLFQKSPLWLLLKIYFQLIEKLHFFKEELLQDFIRKSNTYLQEVIFKELVVLHGPLQGLKYPHHHAFGSQLYPKLIGTYELEIQGVFEKIIQENQIKQFIDIGCAEGYYAVGMALQVPEMKIYAYDDSEEARTLCQEMASLNQVKERVTIREKFHPNSMLDFDTNIPTFILCDCEGCEASIFQEDQMKNFENCTLLIELHDFINPTISSQLQKVFQNTHSFTLLKEKKRKIKNFKNHFKGLPLNTFQKEYMLDEKRPVLMEWLYCKPKK